MSALSEALKVGGAALTQYGGIQMQEQMQIRRDEAMAKREEALARLRAGLQEEAAVSASEREAAATTGMQEFMTSEREATQTFEAGESEKERLSREKIAGNKAEAGGKATAAGVERTANRLQRERESHRKQMEGHTTWGVLSPEYRAQFQAEGDKLIGEGKTAGEAASITLKKLQKLDKMVQGAMESPQAEGKTKEDIINLIMSNDKYRAQLGL